MFEKLKEESNEVKKKKKKDERPVELLWKWLSISINARSSNLGIVSNDAIDITWILSKNAPRFPRRIHDAGKR